MKREFPVDDVQRLANEGYSISAIARKLGIPRTTMQRYCKKHNIEFNSSVQDRREKTFEEKRGISFREWSRERLKKQSREKYGTDNPFQAKEVKEKARKTMLEKYGVEHWIHDDERKKRAKQAEIQTKIQAGQIRVYNDKKYSEYMDQSNLSKSFFYVLVKNYGIDYAISYQKRGSLLEERMSFILDKLGLKYITQYRIDNRYADFFLPDHNLVIETDGLYWHSEKHQPDKHYHFNKRELYSNYGYSSLFFYEDEIVEHEDIVSSMILHRCVISPVRVYARKCDVQFSVDSEWMGSNHLMGPGRSFRGASLVHNGKIVAAMSVKWNNTVDRGLEIHRYCCAINTAVIGGYNKLLRQICNEYKPNRLTTFIDLRYGALNTMQKLGFSLVSCFPSFYWTNGRVRLHRMTFSGNSGYERGFCKIWDAGQARFVRDV